MIFTYSGPVGRKYKRAHGCYQTGEGREVNIAKNIFLTISNRNVVLTRTEFRGQKGKEGEKDKKRGERINRGKKEGGGSLV